MVVTFSASMSAPSLCSALAMADSITFLMMPAPFFGLKARMLRAWSTVLPRTRSATSRPFWGDRRTPRRLALVCMVAPLLLYRGLLAGGMTLERPRQRKLAELVSDHVLGNIDRNVLLAVVDGDGQADEIRQDGGAARPSLDRALVVGGASGIDLLVQMVIDERALFD